MYLNRPDPIALLPLAVDTSDLLYEDFIHLLFLHAHREASVLTDELPEAVSFPSRNVFLLSEGYCG